MKRLSATIDWALGQNTDALSRTLLGDMGSYNLVAVGSGGSLVAAAFAALLHETTAGRLARASTPLEATSRSAPRNTAALLLSARGTNVDIRRAAEVLPALGYDVVSAVTTRVSSPVGRILKGYHAATHEFAVPGGRDGFLATNSLMATLVLLYRAAMSVHESFNEEARALAASHATVTGSKSVLDNRTLVVLAQGWATPAALDFESRFSEAALANVTVTDPRNFAHGRHHWLSVHGADTGIVSLETASSAREAARVLRYLPEGIGVLRVVSAREGPTATIHLVRAVMELAGNLAESRGIDPGRPIVADFGRRLYRSRVARSVEQREETSIAKKRQALFVGPSSDNGMLRTALRKFVENLEQTPFSGLAIDYDGTLCARGRRFEPLEPEVSEQLNRLLREGVLLGVASGRGRSVQGELRTALYEEYWDKVLVGLYNGAQTIQLSEELVETELFPPDSLKAARSVIRPLETILGFETVVRPYQLSLRLHGGADPFELRSVVVEQLVGCEDVSVVASSHSVDILPVGTSKLTVVDAMESRRPGRILRIGDQGSVGGNDFDLLNTGLSLSVDRVSSSLQTCWYLGSPGLIAPKLTVHYLRALKGHGMTLRCDASSLLSTWMS